MYFVAVELELGTYHRYSKMNRNKQPPSSTTNPILSSYDTLEQVQKHIPIPPPRQGDGEGDTHVDIHQNKTVPTTRTYEEINLQTPPGISEHTCKTYEEINLHTPPVHVPVPLPQNPDLSECGWEESHINEKGMSMAVDGVGHTPPPPPPAKKDGVWRKDAEVEDSMVTNRLYAGVEDSMVTNRLYAGVEDSMVANRLYVTTLTRSL